MKENKKKLIAIYSRKSRFTGKGESIENQVEMCKQYINQHYPNVTSENICVYEDEGFSGSNTDRPQFKRMMADAKGKKISTLICYRLDRISRNIGDFAKLIEELNTLSIAFVCIREQFDTNSPLGRAMMYIASVFSQLERETIAERIRDNMYELAKTGRWLGGTTPTGYESKPVEKVTIDGRTRKSYKLTFIPEEIEIVKLIYNKFLETKSLTKVETHLIQNHFLSKTGKNYSRFAVRNILENPVYMAADPDAFQYFSTIGVELCANEADFDGACGMMVYNKTLQQHGHTNREKDIENWIVAIGKHQGVICGADWIKVQDILHQNKSKSFRKPKSNTALLSGILRCAKCGSYMRPKLTQRKNADGELIYTYLCELKERSRGHNCSIRNVNGNVLDKAVCAEIMKLSEDDSVFIQQLHAAQQNLQFSQNESDMEIERLNKTIANNEKEIKNLISNLAKLEDSTVSEYITKQINTLHDSNVALMLRIEELKKVTTTQFLPDDQIEIMKGILHTFSSSFDTMTAEEKNSALRTFIEKITWDGENVNLFLYGFGVESSILPANVCESGSKVPQCEDSK